MKKIAIIGHGYVGNAMERFFNKHFEVVVYDPKYFTGIMPDRVVNSDENVRILFDTDIQVNKNEVNQCDFAVICVPTPEAEDHSVDLSFVRSAVEMLETPLILLKSTVPPGTIDSLRAEFGKRICFSPEYIGEGKYVVQWWKDKDYPHPTDMKYHSFQIVGGYKEDARAVLEFFKLVAGPEVKYIVTDAKTAELCKYMENSWGATKVTFCNEFAKIAENMGVDYDELRELWLLDGRVERMHTAVFKDKRGFGGKCYPKDVNGIVEQSKKAGYTPKLLQAVLAVNEELKTNQ